MSGPVGTWAWAESGGRLLRQDRIQLTAQAMLHRLAQLPKTLRTRLGFGDANASRIDLAAIRIPDTGVARQASDLAHSLSEPWLFNHCQRTYVWGALLAQSEQIEFDEELLFVASALHDLGLTPSHNCVDTSCACFAVEGARAAERFVTERGWADERGQRLAQAISLHLNVSVGLSAGAEAHLLHDGAALDVIGARRREITPAILTTVLEQHPRLGFKQEMRAAMKAQARARPDSRAAFLAGLGFTRMIQAAPFAE
jgi:hypothetical protein